jgi:hypothetical protein
MLGHLGAGERARSRLRDFFNQVTVKNFNQSPVNPAHVSRQDRNRDRNFSARVRVRISHPVLPDDARFCLARDLLKVVV